MGNTDTISTRVKDFIVSVLNEVESYLRETGTAPSMFCKAAVKDPNLLRQIRKGQRRLTFNMAVRIKQYLDSQPRPGN